MLVDTTVRGTARSAFRDRRGRPLLGPGKVAGKTGSLSGKAPEGRYEWFIGAAPADSPTVAIAVVLVQSRLWWRSASQIAGDVLHHVFCPEDGCRAEAALRWARRSQATGTSANSGAPRPSVPGQTTPLSATYSQEQAGFWNPAEVGVARPDRTPSSDP